MDRQIFDRHILNRRDPSAYHGLRDERDRQAVDVTGNREWTRPLLRPREARPLAATITVPSGTSSKWNDPLASVIALFSPPAMSLTRAREIGSPVTELTTYRGPNDASSRLQTPCRRNRLPIADPDRQQDHGKQSSRSLERDNGRAVRSR